jgi:hypothetical protein
MRAPVSLAVAVSLLLPSLPLSAQVPQRYTPQISNWSRVRTIPAGARIDAAYVGRRHGHQYFVSATDETMTVLRPDGLPRSARKTLIEIAGRAFYDRNGWKSRATECASIHGIWLKGHESPDCRTS